MSDVSDKDASDPRSNVPEIVNDFFKGALFGQIASMIISFVGAFSPSLASHIEAGRTGDGAVPSAFVAPAIPGPTPQPTIAAPKVKAAAPGGMGGPV